MPPICSKKQDVRRLFLHQEILISGNNALPTWPVREATPNYMPSLSPVMEESTLFPIWPIEQSYNNFLVSSPISPLERLLLPTRLSRKLFRESSPIRPSKRPLQRSTPVEVCTTLYNLFCCNEEPNLVWKIQSCASLVFWVFFLANFDGIWKKITPMIVFKVGKVFGNSMRMLNKSFQLCLTISF